MKKLNEEMGSKDGKLRLGARDAFTEMMAGLVPQAKKRVLDALSNKTPQEAFAAIKGEATGSDFITYLDKVEKKGDVESFINSIRNRKTTQSTAVKSYDRDKSSIYKTALEEPREQFAAGVKKNAAKREQFSKKTEDDKCPECGQYSKKCSCKAHSVNVDTKNTANDANDEGPSDTKQYAKKTDKKCSTCGQYSKKCSCKAHSVKTMKESIKDRMKFLIQE